MKKFNPYNIKRALLLVVGSGTLGLTACKPDPDPVAPHNTTYTFSFDAGIPMDKIAKSADSASVLKIFLVPTGSWTNLSTANIEAVINIGLKPALAISPKVTGKGDFGFTAGRANAAQISYLTANGWTVSER